MKKSVLFLVMMNVICFAGVMAAEVPPVTPQDFGTSGPTAHWFWALLASPAFLAVTAWLGKFIDRWVRERKLFREYRIAQEAYTFVSYGVDQSWKTLVRGLKEGKENDGKLTEDEKNRALAIAKTHAVDYAAKQGVDLLKAIGPQMLELLIEKIIGDRKAGRLLTGPFPPLPELAP